MQDETNCVAYIAMRTMSVDCQRKSSKIVKGTWSVNGCYKSASIPKQPGHVLRGNMQNKYNKILLQQSLEKASKDSSVATPPSDNRPHPPPSLKHST